jgi:aminopeptidase N
MDLARTPSTADGNPQMADAPPTPREPALIRREDYKPFPWLVPEVTLRFDLGLQRTRVEAALTLCRNARSSSTDRLIRLNGDGITPVEVRLDGQVVTSWSMVDSDLVVDLPGDSHLLEIVTDIDPSANTQLMGLYASGGMLCTQCEAEGFRRITFFPDRPDVLATFRVHLKGQQASFPVLLSNGDLVASGDNGDGTHWAEWYDPWPKPSYLFALVAGDLVVSRDSFTTVSGREVALGIYVRAGDLERTAHAMDSLKRSMAWDEQAFGREYDLATFNIVAVSDFNMGAMENKGLNIFNTKYVLADPETATDGDFDAVEGVIAHEYFHNWSGNRVTCRDWFQLSLKEGFTVLRDQMFSQDMGSAPVKRIEDVRVLRAVQFPEDSGPLAHPIRPDSYREISNFYTATVYNKGAEVIRMIRTIVGPERFRKGCDLYFDRHDGQAATCEDFVKAMEAGAGIDLGRFRLWYAQAGTPKVTVRIEHDGTTATLQMRQEVPDSPGQDDKQPMPIPLRLALFDRATGQHRGEQLVVLEHAQASFAFRDFAEPPVLSINRGFSAPVAIERTIPTQDLVFLAAHDDDPFARYEAMQELVVSYLCGSVDGSLDDAGKAQGREAIVAAFRAVLQDRGLDDMMRGELLILPGQSYLAEQLLVADPMAIHREREALKAHLGTGLQADLTAMHERASALPYDLSAAARGARKLKTQALVYLAAGVPDLAAQMAKGQYDGASNMTDRQGALMVLCGLDHPARAAALDDFLQRYRGNALVVDKWFSLQAQSLHPAVLDHVRALARHPDFTLKNPNRVRSLYMAFTGAPQGFHDASGAGYRLIADLVLALDPINPQTAARFIPPLGRWRRTEQGRAALMQAELQRIAAAAGLSRDTAEQVGRSLG